MFSVFRNEKNERLLKLSLFEGSAVNLYSPTTVSVLVSHLIEHQYDRNQGRGPESCNLCKPGSRTKLILTDNFSQKNVIFMRYSQGQTKAATDGQRQPKITHVFSRTIIIFFKLFLTKIIFWAPASQTDN